MAPAPLTETPNVLEARMPPSVPRAVDGDRLGDRHRAEAGRIEAVDLAARGGLRDRAGEGLARRRAAARIDVVADAGNPGPGGLRVSRRGREVQTKNAAIAARRIRQFMMIPFP